jgi:hypothetical protein
MSVPLTVVGVELDGEDGIIATFSDGTYAAIVLEELLELRPYREMAIEPVASADSSLKTPPS